MNYQWTVYSINLNSLDNTGKTYKIRLSPSGQIFYCLMPRNSASNLFLQIIYANSIRKKNNRTIFKTVFDYTSRLYLLFLTQIPH